MHSTLNDCGSGKKDPACEPFLLIFFSKCFPNRCFSQTLCQWRELCLIFSQTALHRSREEGACTASEACWAGVLSRRPLAKLACKPMQPKEGKC